MVEPLTETETMEKNDLEGWWWLSTIPTEIELKWP